MSGLQSKYVVSLSENQVNELRKLSASYTEKFCLVQRARIILLSHENPEWSNKQIAREVSSSIATVKKWRRRFAKEQSLESLLRSGCKRRFSSLERAQIVDLACTNIR